MKAGVAVVTGSSTGIGRATAIAFAKRGWKSVLLARRMNGLRRRAARRIRRRHECSLMLFASCVLLSLGWIAGAHAANQQAALPGVDFRAVGYEPRWKFELDRQGGIRFGVDGSAAVVVASAPQLNLSTRPAGVIYGARTETHDFVAEIVEMTCWDAVVGERLTHSVTIRVNGREYHGCGKAVAADEIDG
jgi:uncharacterized membrane protein